MAKKTYGPKPAKPPKQSRGLLSGLWNLIKSAIMLPIALFSAIARRLTRAEDLNKSDADERARNNINKALNHAGITNDAVTALIKQKSQDKAYRKEKTNIKKFEMYPPDDLAGFENQDIQYVVRVMLNNKQRYVLGLQYDGTGGYTIVKQNGTPDGIADNLKEQVAQLLKDVSMRTSPENENQPADHDPAPIDTQDEPTPEEPPSSNEEAGKDEQNADMEAPEPLTPEQKPEDVTCISYLVEEDKEEGEEAKEEGEENKKKETKLSFVYYPIANDTGKHVGGYCDCCMTRPGEKVQIATEGILAIDTKTLSGIGPMLADNGHQLDPGETLQYIATCQTPPQGLILVPSDNGRALLINMLQDSTVSVSKLQEYKPNEFEITPITEAPITRSELLSNNDVRAAQDVVKGVDVIDNTQQVEAPSEEEPDKADASEIDFEDGPDL